MRSLIVAAVFAALASPALAQLQDENLLAGVPEGFVLGYNAAKDGAEIYEFVPEGESVETWTAMVTIQIFPGLDELEGDRFAVNMAQNWKSACRTGTATKLTESDVNGFPFVLRTFLCPLNPHTGKPETMYFKGITGSDAFYSVQYAFRQEHADELDTIALPYLIAASACDTRKPERPCPAGM